MRELFHNSILGVTIKVNCVDKEHRCKVEGSCWSGSFSHNQIFIGAQGMELILVLRQGTGLKDLAIAVVNEVDGRYNML